MSQIASKNLYDLLGNDPEADPDRAPEPPTKVIDKPGPRIGKRNAGGEAPAAAAAGPRAAGARGGRQGQPGRSDEAVNNRAERDGGERQDRRPREPREGGYRGRGTRGGPRGSGGRTNRSTRDDRQSHSGIGEHEKQAAHGWGKEGDGNAELTDERAGEAIADAETKNDAGFTADVSGADPAFANGPDGETNAEAVAEAEDNTKSYDQYLKEQAEKRAALGSSLEFRKANEGSKQKFPEGSAFSRTEENYFAGGPGKARREKNQKAKELVTIDGNYYAAPDAGDRGGRGGARGGRGGRGGRGEFRGGERGARGSGRGRGESRGGARGDFRGGAPRGESRGGPRGGFNTADQSAFPALGGN